MSAHTGLSVYCARAHRPVGAGPYLYLVTAGGLQNGAFRTRAPLMQWMELLGLTPTQEIPEPGAVGGSGLHIRIEGTYRTRSYLQNAAEFEALGGVFVRTMSNSEWTLGKITRDPDGVRTLHSLNPNVRSRVLFDPAESRRLQDEGRITDVSGGRRPIATLPERLQVSMAGAEISESLARGAHHPRYAAIGLAADEERLALAREVVERYNDAPALRTALLGLVEATDALMSYYVDVNTPFADDDEEEEVVGDADGALRAARALLPPGAGAGPAAAAPPDDALLEAVRAVLEEGDHTFTGDNSWRASLTTEMYERLRSTHEAAAARREGR